MRNEGINIKWIANDNRPGDWHIGGFREGNEGAIITGNVKGLVHVPFKGIWHEPAYGPPRFERTVDERREISMRVTLMSDSSFGWFDTESRWWDGMTADQPGYLSVFTHHKGELYLPLQLVDAVESDFEDDPTNDGFNAHEWDILLAADGEPRFRAPDLRPSEWFNDMTITKEIKRDDEKLSPKIEVGVGKLKVANRGTQRAWPIYTVTAPGRCWLPNGMTGEMIRVPPLNKGEHVTIDTNPEHRIAISDMDPRDTFLNQRIRSSELLRWLFGQDSAEPGVSILERFHGQGFDVPIEPNSMAILPVYHSQPGARISVRLPQVYERPIS
ncbi:hypothetical protein EB72_24825 [Mycobacterium sp. SWH-M1]|nr:hypothetical protein EB72_24825 [Mycobacterium sp. SWH-M1]